MAPPRPPPPSFPLWRRCSRANAAPVAVRDATEEEDDDTTAPPDKNDDAEDEEDDWRAEEAFVRASKINLWSVVVVRAWVMGSAVVRAAASAARQITRSVTVQKKGRCEDAKRRWKGQLAVELASISRDGGGASSKSGEGEEVEPEVEVQRADDTAVVE